jgi:ATP synthase proteolipid subunit
LPTRRPRARGRPRFPRTGVAAAPLRRSRARASPVSRARRSSRADIGAAYGTAKSGVGIASMGVMNPGLVMRNIIPVVMAGVLGIYGLIVAVILQGAITQPSNGVAKFSSFSG